MLVEGDPCKDQVIFLYSTPVGQERRLPVSCWGADDAQFAVRGIPEEIEQPATDQLLGARQRRPQLGLEDDPRRITA